MLWVIQNNLFNEEGYARFVNALIRLELEYIVIKPIPFTNTFVAGDFDSFKDNQDEAIEPFIDTSKKIMAMGATSLTRVSLTRGWMPGTYMNDNFDFEKWRDGYGKENILNPNAMVGRVGDYFDLSGMDWVFVRPVLDTKTFSGEVKSKYDFKDWQQSIKFMEEFMVDELIGIARLDKNTVISVAPVKTIYAEWRMFVVDDKFVTGSMYQQGGKLITNEFVEDRVIKFTRKMIRKWKPADAYVIDIADTPDGLKVIEINNINSSGYYDADVQKIIMALEDLNK